MRSFKKVCVAAVLALAGSASADITDFRVWAGDGQGGWGQVIISTTAATWQNGQWQWQSTAPIPIPYTAGGTGNVGMIDSLSIQYIADPVVNLNFVVTAGLAPTHFVITSALLSFPAIPGAIGNASAGVTVTDADQLGGATLIGHHAGGHAYLPNYNGFVPGGTTFVSPLVAGPVVAPPGGTTPAAGFHPATPIGPPVFDMSAQWDFTLTPLDSASGTSSYQIIPAPGAAAGLLAGLGLVSIRRRRR